MDMTLQQAAILAAVSRSPGITQTEIFSALATPGAQKINFSQAVTRLAKRGLVAKSKKSNGVPINSLKITGPGREALKRAEDAARFILGTR